MLNPQLHPKENPTLEWQTHARHARGQHDQTLAEYHPKKISTLTSRSTLCRKRSKQEAGQSPLAPTHNTWSPPAVSSPIKPAGVHRHQLDRCDRSSSPEDDVWSPPATPRSHEQGPEQIPTPDGTRVQPYESSHTKHSHIVEATPGNGHTRHGIDTVPPLDILRS